MGGNAIKIHFGIDSKRIDAETYDELTQRVLSLLEEIPFRKQLIPCYRNKPDFGDADILIESPQTFDLSGAVKRIFGVTPSANGGCYSFPYEDFQIDLILVRPEIFDMAIFYFSYNDFGNLLGKLFHWVGISLGHQGLKFKLREDYFGMDSNHMLNKLLITTDRDQILEFAGLDVERYKQGFDDLEDIFKYVCSSRFFDPEFFALENLNNVDRIRDRKRTTYTKFLDWLEVHKSEYPVSTLKPEAIIQEMLEKFPNVVQDIAEVKSNYDKHQLIKSKFNGDLVKEWKGLTGQELGIAINRYKKSFPPNGFEVFVYENDVETIKGHFNDFCLSKGIV